MRSTWRIWCGGPRAGTRLVAGRGSVRLCRSIPPLCRFYVPALLLAPAFSSGREMSIRPVAPTVTGDSTEAGRTHRKSDLKSDCAVARQDQVVLPFAPEKPCHGKFLCACHCKKVLSVRSKAGSRGINLASSLYCEYDIKSREIERSRRRTCRISYRRWR